MKQSFETITEEEFMTLLHKYIMRNLEHFTTFLSRNEIETDSILIFGQIEEMLEIINDIIEPDETTKAI